MNEPAGANDDVGPPDAAAPSRRERTVRGRARGAAAMALIVVGALLAPVAVVAVWAERALTDTDHYVATVAPLAKDPVVRSAVAGRLTQVLMVQLDVPSLVDGVVGALRERDVAPRAASALAALEAPLASGVESFVRDAADRVVASDQFETAWERANRVAHEQLVAVMQGSGGSIVQVGRDGQLTIQLAGMIELLKDRLVDRGFTLAASLPTVNATFTIMETTQLVEVRNRYAQIVALGTWLPWLVLVLLASGVAVAVHRPRALATAGLSLAAAMAVLAAGTAIARGLYLDHLSGTVLRLDAAEAVFDQVVVFLWSTLCTVGVVGLLVALAAYLAAHLAGRSGHRAT